MKKLLSLLVVLALVVSMVPAVFAAENPEIVFTSAPEDITAKQGNYVNFHVDIEGLTDGDQIKWYYQLKPNGGWFALGAFQNAFTDTMKIQAMPKRDGFRYRCRVVDGETGKKYYSESAVLTVDYAPYNPVIKSPESATIQASTTHRFVVETQGEGLTYEWQYHKKGVPEAYFPITSFKGNYLDRQGVTGATNRDGFGFRCKITDANGYVTYTDTALLTVDDIEFTVQPQDNFVEKTGNISFTADFNGEYNSIQWMCRKWVPSLNEYGAWQVASGTGVNAKTFTTTAMTGSGASRDLWQYRLQVTGTDGVKRFSNSAHVYYDEADIVITEQPVPVNNANVGDMVTFNVAATGSHLRYQWMQKLADSDVWYILPGEDEATLEIEVSDKNIGASFKAVVSNPAGESVESEEATLTMALPEIAITVNPTDVTADLESIATFTAEATGEGIAYQWYENDVAIEGANAATLEVVANELTNGKQYKVVATDALGQTAESTAATLTVNLDVTFQLMPNNVPGTAETHNIPAGYSRKYTTMVGGCNMIIRDANASVLYNGETYTADEEGVITIALAETNRFMMIFNNLEIFNNGEEAAVFEVEFQYDLGHRENPEIITESTALGADLAEGDVDGYFYKFIAPEDGKLTLKLYKGWDVLNEMVVECNSVQNSMLQEGTYDANDEYAPGVLTYDVKAGDEYYIQLIAVEGYQIDETTYEIAVDENGNKIVSGSYPAAYVMGDLIFESGSKDHPYQLNFMDLPTNIVMTNKQAAGEEVYYMASQADVQITLNANATVKYNGNTYEAVDGVVSFALDSAAEDPTLFSVTYNGTGSAAMTFKVENLIGSWENPAVLQEGTNVATVKADNWGGYYFTFTAPSKGVLTISVSGANGWSYQLNNLTIGSYGDRQNNVDGNAIASMNLLDGDEIQLNVNTYAGEDAPVPAGEITVLMTFETLGDVEIEQPLPEIPEDGEA